MIRDKDNAFSNGTHLYYTKKIILPRKPSRITVMNTKQFLIQLLQFLEFQHF